MTKSQRGRPLFRIIPYQELLGNYDGNRLALGDIVIIPYQELLGNYDFCRISGLVTQIIPYQELLGNYDQFHCT